MATPNDTAKAPTRAQFGQQRENEEQHRIWLNALLNEFDVARITGLSVASVRRWRLHRKGPKFIKVGKAVRYRIEDLASFIKSCPTGGGAES